MNSAESREAYNSRQSVIPSCRVVLASFFVDFPAEIKARAQTERISCRSAGTKRFPQGHRHAGSHRRRQDRLRAEIFQGSLLLQEKRTIKIHFYVW